MLPGLVDRLIDRGVDRFRRRYGLRNAKPGNDSKWTVKVGERIFLLVTCADLQSLCRLAVEDKLDDPAYFAPAGPIVPIDVLYGRRAQKLS
jgi:hypothetical protein